MHIIVEKDWSIEKIQELADKQKPDYIFFPFYSHKIPRELYDNYKCVVFHMTDLPFGRGGSPLQNLIVYGHKETKLSAIIVNSVYDGGKVWSNKPSIDLGGTAREIYARTRVLIDSMVDDILNGKGEFDEQRGSEREFKRRTPEQSNLSSMCNLPACYDHIRMLDADGYPNAFLRSEGLRFEFTNANLKVDCLTADVRITYDRRK